MMKGVQESLAGRVALLQLSPLSYGEIMEDDGTPPFRVELSALTERQDHRTAQFSNGQVIQRNRLPAPALLLSQVLQHSGFAHLMNYKGIADDAEIDQATAKNWLHILETLGIVFLLRPYSNNVLKRTVSTPKLYFYDTGLVCYLTRWSSPETAMNGAMNGALLENYTVSEIVKTYQNAGQEPFLYYYRDKDAREIDLLLEQDGKLFPIEIKKMAAPPKKLTKVFELIGKSPLERGTGAVLCMAERLGAFDKDNLIVPISLISEQHQPQSPGVRYFPVP